VQTKPPDISDKDWADYIRDMKKLGDAERFQRLEARVTRLEEQVNGLLKLVGLAAA
jgi:hypothetical protein